MREYLKNRFPAVDPAYYEEITTVEIASRFIARMIDASYPNETGRLNYFEHPFTYLLQPTLSLVNFLNKNGVPCKLQGERFEEYGPVTCYSIQFEYQNRQELIDIIAEKNLVIPAYAPIKPADHDELLHRPFETLEKAMQRAGSKASERLKKVLTTEITPEYYQKLVALRDVYASFVDFKNQHLELLNNYNISNNPETAIRMLNTALNNCSSLNTSRQLLACRETYAAFHQSKHTALYQACNHKDAHSLICELLSDLSDNPVDALEGLNTLVTATGNFKNTWFSYKL